MATKAAPLSFSEVTLLGKLRLNHIRVDLDMSLVV